VFGNFPVHAGVGLVNLPGSGFGLTPAGNQLVVKSRLEYE